MSRPQTYGDSSEPTVLRGRSRMNVPGLAGCAAK